MMLLARGILPRANNIIKKSPVQGCVSHSSMLAASQKAAYSKQERGIA
jgi:hypothetical protein